MERRENNPERKRATWKNQTDFLFACVASGVGLGNVWRFPYLCYINGGGAFLIPYIFFVLTCGIPLTFLEMALGQFTAQNGIAAWNICPLLEGCGMASLFMIFFVLAYYNVIVAWILYYLFNSLTATLPWSTCGNPWNTDSCYDGNHIESGNLTSSNQTHATGNVSSAVLLGMARKAIYNTDPVNEFWENKALHISEGINSPGHIKWDLALCLLTAYLLLYLCLWRGLKESRISLYATVCTPYLLLVVMVIRGATLPGSLQGIKYYLLPTWGRLMDLRVWADAGTQVFYSYAICIGVLPTLASYNPFHRNCMWDAVVFSCANSFTSLFAGFVIFTVLGFMAHIQGLPIADVAESGPGLAFIAYPKALTKMPVASLWSVLFFLMLLLLGLSSMLGILETVIVSLSDVISPSLTRGHRPKLVLAVTCLILFVLGLPMVTRGGMYVFQLQDLFVCSKLGLLIGCFECFILCYCYGIRRFSEDVRCMLGKPLPRYFRLNWLLVTPLVLAVVFVLNILEYSEVRYNKTYVYPDWAVSLGWIIALAPFSFIPGVAIVKILKMPGTFAQRVKKLMNPDESVLQFGQRNAESSLQSSEKPLKEELMTSTI